MTKDIFTADQFEVLSQVFEAILAEVDKRIAAQPSVRHVGVWREGKFKSGSLCTHQGGLWLAKHDTDARPGVDESWLLVVKSGHGANGAEPRKHVHTGVRR